MSQKKFPPILSLNLHFLSLLGLGAKMGKRNVFLIEAATFFLRPDFESENVPRVSSLSEQAPDTTTIPSHLKQLSRIGNDFREITLPKMVLQSRQDNDIRHALDDDARGRWMVFRPARVNGQFPGYGRDLLPVNVASTIKR